MITPRRPGSISIETILLVAGLEMADAIPLRKAAPTMSENSGATPTQKRDAPATIKVVTVARRPPTRSTHLPSRAENRAPLKVPTVASIPNCHRSMFMAEINSEARTPKVVMARVTEDMVMTNIETKRRRREEFKHSNIPRPGPDGHSLFR